jgi:hypothetical protein
LLQVSPCLLRPGCPALGAAEIDQRQAAQLLAQAGLRRLRGPGHGLQLLRQLGHPRQVAASAGRQQLDHPEQHPQTATPAFGHGRRPAFGQRQVPLCRLQRPLGQLIARS